MYGDLYLEHHGIKGQKWGKRNGPPYPLDPETDYTDSELKENNKHAFNLTDKQKKYIKNGAIAAATILVVAGGLYLYKNSKIPTMGITPYNFGTILNINELSDKVVTLKKGSTLQRISHRPIKDSIEHGKMYVSHLKLDNAAYSKEMPKVIREWKGQGIVNKDSNIFIHKMKLKRDVKIASQKDVAEAYMKITGSSELDHGKLQSFYANLIDDTEANQKFINFLKAKGFDGMIDYNDAKNWTKEPLILFAPKEFIDKTSSHKLTKLDHIINVMTS